MPEKQGRADLQLPPGVFADQRQAPGARLVSPGRIKQQIVRGVDGLERAAWILGLAWPFVVALFGIVLTAAGVNFSDQGAVGLLLCSFLGSPLVIACIHHSLPERWPEVSRVGVTVLLAGPCILGETSLALLGFGVGYIVAGGHIPC